MKKLFFLFAVAAGLAVSQQASAHYLILDGRKPTQLGNEMGCPVKDHSQCRIGIHLAKDGRITVVVGGFLVTNPAPGAPPEVVSDRVKEIMGSGGTLPIEGDAAE